MDKIFTFYGDCPKLKARHLITIRYGELNFCGDSQTYYSKLSYSCSQGSNCNYKDDYGQCPVYLAAPKNPF